MPLAGLDFLKSPRHQIQNPVSLHILHPVRKICRAPFHTDSKIVFTMATISTMAVLCAKPIKSLKPAVAPPRKTFRSMTLLSLQGLPKGLTLKSSSAAAVIAGALFANLSTADAAFAVQQIADVAEGDNRGLALLLPILPAVLWVLYNILQPALNQVNRMRSEKGFVVGLALGSGLVAAGFLPTPGASALQQIADIAEAGGDSRGLALLLPIVPAILWVLYNILKPALNQINRMRSG